MQTSMKWLEVMAVARAPAIVMTRKHLVHPKKVMPKVRVEMKRRPRKVKGFRETAHAVSYEGSR